LAPLRGLLIARSAVRRCHSAQASATSTWPPLPAAPAFPVGRSGHRRRGTSGPAPGRTTSTLIWSPFAPAPRRAIRHGLCRRASRTSPSRRASTRAGGNASRLAPRCPCRRVDSPGLRSHLKRTKHVPCVGGCSCACARCWYRLSAGGDWIASSLERAETSSRRRSPSGMNGRAGQSRLCSSAARVRRGSGRPAPAASAAPLFITPRCRFGR
jgi:hypothetical protein